MNRSVCSYCGKTLRKARRQDAKFCDSACRMAALRQRRRLQRERRHAPTSSENGEQAGAAAPSSSPMNSVQACQAIRQNLLGNRDGLPRLQEHPFLQIVAEAAAAELTMERLHKRLVELKEQRARISGEGLADASIKLLRDGEKVELPVNTTHIALTPMLTTEGARVLLVIARKE